MTHGHDPEAAVASLRGQGVRAIRLLYTDLHGVARGKDIPIGHFVDLLEDGVAFCAVIMGTDLSHTPVVGGEQGYVDFAIRPDLDTLRVVPWQPEVAWCLGEAWTLDGSDHWPSCPRALLARVVARYATHGLAPDRGAGARVVPLHQRDPTAPNGLGRYVDELSRVYTVGAISDPRQINLQDAPLGGRARAQGVRGEPRVHELAVRDQPQALGRARRGRPRVHAQGGREGGRGDRGAARDVHGPARSPTRAGRASTSTCRSRTPTGSNAFAADGGPTAEPARRCTSSRA